MWHGPTTRTKRPPNRVHTIFIFLFYVTFPIYNTIIIVLLWMSIALEAASGCPLPDLRYSRPRKFDTGGSTELPTGAPPDALSTDVPDAPGEDDESRLTADRGDADVARHSRYIDYDPYAREEAKTFAYTGNDIAPSHIDLDHQHTIHRRRRRRHTVWSGSAKPTESKALTPFSLHRLCLHMHIFMLNRGISVHHHHHHHHVIHRRRHFAGRHFEQSILIRQ